MDLENKLTILNSNYWEHFKFAKELAGYLNFYHPKRRKIEDKLNEMIEEIQLINKKINEK